LSEEPGDRLDVGSIERALEARAATVGRPIVLLEQIGSTNDVAAAEARRGAPHGTLVLAEHQNAGRGRQGRSWHSPPGQNLYLSLVLRPEAPAERLAGLTLVLGLAVADALARFVPDASVSIKWPNDVLVGGRKCAGILVETAFAGARPAHVVAGIGVNVLERAFPPELAPIATSVAMHAGAAPSRLDVLVQILEQVSARLFAFERAGLESVLPEVRARDAAFGARVRVGETQGVADGIAEDGRLRVRRDDGAVVLVAAGELGWVREG
jgi:BirA family biotin operon repressor/biotin-[acetyl-CoA-carboxylase] ligase